MRDYDSRYPDDYDERPSRAPRRSSSAYSDDDYDAPASRRASSASRYNNPYDDRSPSSSAGSGGYVGGRSRGSTYSNPYADDTYSGGRSSRAASATGAYDTSSLNSGSRSSYNTGTYDTGYTNRTASGGSYGASSRSSQASYNTGAYSNPYATSSRSASRSSATGAYDTGAINRASSGSAYGSPQRSSPASYNTGAYNTGYTSAAGRSPRGNSYDDYGSTASRSSRGSAYGSGYDDYGSTASRPTRSSAYGSGYDNDDNTSGRSSRSSAYGSGYDDYSSTASRPSTRGSSYGNGYDDYGSTSSRSARGGAYGSPASRSSRANPYSGYDDDDDYGGRSSRRSSSAKSAVQKKNKALNIWLACLSGLLVISIAMAFLLPEMLRAEAPPPASNSAPEDTYDMNANPLPLEELGDTVLAASEDGGTEYITNTLFIGDDNIERMLDYAALSEMLTLDNCIGVGGMSVQAVSSFGCVQFEGQSTLATIPEAVTLMQPLRILFAYGSSDATSAADVDGFVSSYRIALESVRAAYSYADIIVCAIPPVAQASGGNSAKMTAIDVYNVQLARLAQELGLKFLNVSETLKDPATGYCQSSYMVEDSLHLNEAGLTALVNYARSHTNITEDTRPKPLKDIPKRVSENDTSDASSSVASSLAASSRAASATSSTDGVKVVFSTLEHVQQSTTVGGQNSGGRANHQCIHRLPATRRHLPHRRGCARQRVPVCVLGLLGGPHCQPRKHNA